LGFERWLCQSLKWKIRRAERPIFAHASYILLQEIPIRLGVQVKRDRAADTFRSVDELEPTRAPLTSETYPARVPRTPAGVAPACSLRPGRTKPPALRVAFLKPGGTVSPRHRRVS